MKEKAETVLAWLKHKILGKNNVFLGIDIGSSSVKVAEIQTENGLYRLKNVGIAALHGAVLQEDAEPLEELETVLRQLLETNNIQARDAILSIGGRDFFAREVSFPKMEPAELAEAVKWDITKYVPYEEGQYYYDFDVLPENTDLPDEVRVILVAAPKQAVDDLVMLVKRLHLRPVAIEGESFALARTLRAEENYILVDVGKENSKIVIFQGQVPIATRNVPVYGDSFTEAVQTVMELSAEEAEALKQRRHVLLLQQERDGLEKQEGDLAQKMEGLAEDLVNEIRRTMEYYRIQNKNAVIDKVFISGGGACLENLVEYIAAAFTIPVLRHQPLENVVCGAPFDPVYLDSIAPQIAVAAGLAMRGGEI